MILYVIGEILLVIGALFLFLASLGLIRMPDVYNRMQAGTKGTTFGAIMSILGIGFMRPEWLIKSFVIVLFILLTNPISSNLLIRATHRIGVPLGKKAVDEYMKDKEEGVVEK